MVNRGDNTSAEHTQSYAGSGSGGAVRQKKFNIWAVEHIDQGLEILTGVEAGIADENGKFPDDSIHGRVNKKLSEWNDKRRWGRERNQRPSAVRRRRNAW